ncbi:MAG: hypothetical protein R3B70_21750 [Polyangiaceae bacterium]
MSLAPPAAAASAAAADTATPAAPPAPPVPLSTAVPCGAKAPPPWPLTNPALGAWGEDRKTVPHFGYLQESRAPKMPDGDDYFRRLPTRTVAAMDDALLICHVETYTRNGNKPLFYRYKLGRTNPTRPRCMFDWDTFAPPDVLMRFRLRGEHPISLYAPEDHWGYFISIPRIRLAKGDFFEVKLFDRDSSGDTAGASEEDAEYMGYASTTLTGKWPITLEGPYFKMTCNAMQRAEAERNVQRWMAPLDAKIRAIETARPDPSQWGFGHPKAFHDKGEQSFGRGNFRYVAGFLGWDHPWILDRRKRIDTAIEIEWPKKVKQAAKDLAKKAPAPGIPMSLGARNGTLRATGVVCDTKSCTVAMELKSALVKPGEQGFKTELAGVDDNGEFHYVYLVPKDPPPQDSPAPDAGAPAAPPKPSATPIEYTVTLHRSDRVLWIKSPSFAYTVKVTGPDPE